MYILVRFYRNLNFLDRFSKNTQISYSIKNRPAGAELFLADERTARHEEANSNFSQFCEKLLSPKKKTENVSKAKLFCRVRVIAAILATTVTKRLLVTLVTKIITANTQTW